MADVPLLKSPVPVSEIDATGTADATTFLRGDGSWQTPAGGGGGSLVACRASKGTNQSVANATETAITWGTEDYDDGGMIDLASNSTRITIQTAGRFRISAGITWAGSSSGHRRLQLRLNGTDWIAADRCASGTNQPISQGVSTEYDMAAGDYVEVVGYQDSGGALNASFISSVSSFFAASQIN